MNHIKRAAPSPALLVAVLALVAALAGTAVAGPDATTSVSKKKTKKIANKQAKKQINKTLPIDSSELADGAVSGSKLGPIEQVSQTSPGAAAPPIDATATCPSGSTVLGGGFDASPGVSARVSKRTDNGWRADGTATAAGQTITAYAYCLDSNG